MREISTGARGTRFFEYSAKVSAFILFTICVSSTGHAQTADQTPPSAPTGLVASAASCGQVDLSWGASTDNVGGSGLKAYTIYRNDGVSQSIGAVRTSFSDTNWVRSSTALTYYVVAQDNAGNVSVPSNTVSVSTTSCPASLGEQVVDSASSGPLGKSMATYGTRTVMLYQKSNIYSTRDTWLYVSDSDTGQSSQFLLHSSPGYSQVETDYVLTSATDLWTLSFDSGSLGKLLVSQYKLNGTPPTAATLVSTKSLGDNYSVGMSMIRLQSGALVVGWSDMSLYPGAGSGSYTGDLIAGYAYRSPTGSWIIKTPATLASSGGVYVAWKTRMALAQHPADGSVWMFVKEDTSSAIEALHFTEATSDFILDWINASYISQTADGNNGPEGEFPYLAATSDPTRNVILLAYQNEQYQFVFTDPLFGSMSNNILLKQSYATIAKVNPDGSKVFIPFDTYIERITLFGMSVLSDGTIWLAYQPINSQSLTWNEVYASKYQNSAWSTPVLAGLDYNDYNNANGLDVALVYRTDQPQVAFRTPDQKIHTFDLSNLGAAPGDTTPPTTSITNPASGTTVSGTVSVSASAADNVGVASVQLLTDSVVVGTSTSAPYNFVWNTTALPNGNHTLQTRALDAAGNTGVSMPVTVTVSNLMSSSLTVAVTNPQNGSTVPRNQKVTVSAAASDTITVTKMEFYVNSSLLGTTTTAPYTYPWKVPGKRGQYQIQAKAYDAAGKSAAQAITVTAQ
jgi:Bacterial Ig domain